MSAAGTGVAPAPVEDEKAKIEAARTVLAARSRSGANWFFWIAGLSVVNSVLVHTGSNTQFIIGLGITQFADGVGQELGKQGMAEAGTILSLVVNVFMVVLFVCFGLFARKQATWAFYVGLAFYALDALIYLAVHDFLGLGFHVFVLYCLYKGLAAQRLLDKLNTALSPTAVNTGPAPIG